MEITTRRLRLSPLSADDADFSFALHSDPATYQHAPYAVTTDRAEFDESFERGLQEWVRDGAGYCVVEHEGERIGVAGVRLLRGSSLTWPDVLRRRMADAGGRLNLYYRLRADVHGQGFGREVARAVVEWAVEHGPELPLVALVSPNNPASLRTAERAGMLPAPDAFSADGGPDGEGETWRVLTAPAMVRVDAASVNAIMTEELRDAVLALWHDVTAAGGAVGFPPGSPVSMIEPVLERHLAAIRAGEQILGLALRPDDRPVGMGFWTIEANPLFAHTSLLKRFQVHPDLQRRNLGRVVLAGLHRMIARQPGVDILRLDYRSGAGTGDFYAGMGYLEVGRQPQVIQPAPGDRRDLVAMVRRVDGAPLEYDGRT